MTKAVVWEIQTEHIESFGRPSICFLANWKNWWRATVFLTSLCLLISLSVCSVCCLILFPCCTTVGAAASSAIMKGHQSTGPDHQTHTYSLFTADDALLLHGLTKPSHKAWFVSIYLSWLLYLVWFALHIQSWIKAHNASNVNKLRLCLSIYLFVGYVCHV